MSFGLSTSWNAFRHSGGRDLIFEIKKAGFSEVELGFNLTQAMVEEVAALVKDGQVRVLSTHNYCPIPEGLKREEALPDCYSMASLDERQRKMAVDQTKKTIETAKRLSARAVVLHCGRVEIADRTKHLMQLYVDNRRESRDFDEFKSDIVKERERLARPFFENTLKSLKELSGFAASQGIALGIENRIYYREIPSFQEIGIILDRFRNQGVQYWHDTGHAQIMENLGLARHKDYLESYAKDLIGCHFHDVAGCHDHQAPSKGELDFAFLQPYLKKETIRIIEAHYPATEKDIADSKVYLENIFGA
ncbi:MAG TPA: TIM barrel protein [Patescibacteria group bacterium]|nr:TIM barrel protein [Patescibacteria group bacterium]